ncbi:MAG: aminopeptidase [Candidatus Parabeggiatoa sp. nov. 1]|nr:MAG: aminopeptidase [Gammaproteobacteria bacterium]
MLKHSLLILCLSSLGACSNITYYSQAIGGQLDIFRRSQPIERVLADSATPALLKRQLTDILKIRAFASEVLYLPDNGSYTSYADLERPFVVWSVFATPTFSFKPKQWCFFIVGCVSYRGYFAETSAQTLAEELRAQNYDVYVAGIPAYSTVGWFDDPVLNTMLGWAQPQIAGLIFHELAHQQLYIKDDTAFNEAFAMTVEYVGVERWLAQFGIPEDIVRYQQSRLRQAEFVKLVLAARNRLQQIYLQNLPQKKMPAAKTAAFDTLQAQYRQLKNRWNGFAGYDGWFAKDLNNAKLLSVVTYQDYVPAFRALLDQLGGDLPAFYQAVAQLGELPIKERHVQLRERGR